MAQSNCFPDDFYRLGEESTEAIRTSIHSFTSAWTHPFPGDAHEQNQPFVLPWEASRLEEEIPIRWLSWLVGEVGGQGGQEQSTVQQFLLQVSIEQFLPALFSRLSLVMSASLCLVKFKMQPLECRSHASGPSRCTCLTAAVANSTTTNLVSLTRSSADVALGLGGLQALHRAETGR